MSRSRIVLSIALLAVIAGVLTFPLWRPLFVNDVVNEAFPDLSAEMQAAFAEMPEAQQIAFTTMQSQNPEMAQAMVEAALSPDVPAAEAMPASAATPEILVSGQFIQIDALHGAEGSATIYTLTDGSHVLRFEGFRATNGPDLHVVLSQATDPRNHDALGEYIDLGSLKGNVGDQNYVIPEDVDLSQIQSVVIYCVPFQVVFSTATLAS
jgi:Electron transfer DM13